jgi:hypothetical protein
MSDCTRSLDDLLEADLDELRGESVTEVGRHIRDCGQCRSVAQRILDSTARLDAALATRPGGFDVNAVLARARSPKSTPQAATITPLRSRWQRIASVALAASIVGLLVLGDRDQPLPGTAFVPSLRAELPIVEPSVGQNVVVIKTDNPDITVLWFY